MRTVEVDVALPVGVRGETATAERLLRVVHDVLEVDVVAVVRDGVRQLLPHELLDFVTEDEAERSERELHEENTRETDGEEFEKTNILTQCSHTTCAMRYY